MVLTLNLLTSKLYHQLKLHARIINSISANFERSTTFLLS